MIEIVSLKKKMCAVHRVSNWPKWWICLQPIAQNSGFVHFKWAVSLVLTQMSALLEELASVNTSQNTVEWVWSIWRLGFKQASVYVLYLPGLVWFVKRDQTVFAEKSPLVSIQSLTLKRIRTGRINYKMMVYSREMYVYTILASKRYSD